MVDKLKVAILGATGLVGQRFVQMLSRHPWFEIALLTASEASIDKKYRDAVTWVLETPIPENLGELQLMPTDPESIPKDIDIVFSALPSDVALPIEIELAKRGFVVVSNSSPLRLEPDVPLINPEVNWEHLELIDIQRGKRSWSGVIVKNPNCTTAILTLAIKPILDRFGIEKIVVSTLQSVSGAGLRGVPSMLIIDNVVPFIKNEEEKIENETRKILGKLRGKQIVYADIPISAITTRVPVLEGHLELVHTKLRESFDVEHVIEALENFTSLPQRLALPTAPPRPIVVRREEDRPQPRLDRFEGNGMSVVVGRVRKAENLGEKWLKLVVLGHNTIRGAAGIAVLIAELYAKLRGLV